MLPIIFVIPIVQLLILVNAATMEMRNITIVVVDKDMSGTSRKMIDKFAASPFFKISKRTFDLKEAENELKSNDADLIIHIPAKFEQTLVRENKAKVQILINAINGTVGGISNAYVSSIISGFNQQVITEWTSAAPHRNVSMNKNININYSYWYNPQLNYKTFMVPAILVLLVTIIGMFLSGMNVVREKEMGTIEQINVTPIKRYQFIAGKLLPFWIIALFELGFGLTIGKLLFDIPIVGSIALLYLVAAVYLLSVLGLGLLVSTMTNTQQQAMFVSFFFMIIFIMMSGIFTSTDNMPDWAKILDLFNPVWYFMCVVRMILLKGSTFVDIQKYFYALLIFGFCILTLAVRRYHKTA